MAEVGRVSGGASVGGMRRSRVTQLGSTRWLFSAGDRTGSQLAYRFNVTTPTAPTFDSSAQVYLTEGTDCGGVAIIGNYGFARISGTVSFDEAISTFDISGAAITREATFDSAGSNLVQIDRFWGTDFFAVNDRTGRRVYIIDATNPLSLSVAASLQDLNDFFNTQAVCCDDRYAYLMSTPGPEFGTRKRLTVIDCATKTAPVVVGTGDINDSPNDSEPRGICVSPDSTWVATTRMTDNMGDPTDFPKTFIYDVSNKTNPTHVATITHVALDNSSTDVMEGAAPSSSVLVVTEPLASPPEYRKYDMSDPSNPTQIDSATTPGAAVAPRHLTPFGGRYIAGTSGNLLVVIDWDPSAQGRTQVIRRR